MRAFVPESKRRRPCIGRRRFRLTGLAETSGHRHAPVAPALRRLVGEKVALDLVLTGRVLPAEEARSAGLISRVVPDAELERHAEVLAAQLAATSATALGITKQLFYQLDTRNLADGIALGARANAVARGTPDFREAVATFLRK